MNTRTAVTSKDRPRELLPPDVAEILDNFLRLGRYGTLTLEIKAGRIVEGKLTQAFRVAPRQPEE